MAQPTFEIPIEQQQHLLKSLVHQRICECIDFGKLADLEQHIAIELARSATISDAEMLAGARGVIARVLHAIAGARTRVRRYDEEDLDTRYLNAISCEGLDGVPAK